MKKVDALVFLAVSYRPACQAGVYRSLLELLVGALEREGIGVYLAPREESWGQTRPARNLGIERDMSALRDAELFFVFLDGNEADGALVETGIALGMEKKVWILKRREEQLPPYISGLASATNTRIMLLDDKSDISLLSSQAKMALKPGGS